jgi:hypothetical protein
MRKIAMVVVVGCLASAAHALAGPIGTWLSTSGDIVAFDDDGTGVNLTRAGERVAFTHTSDVEGKITLTGGGVATDYRYVTDGQSLLLKVSDSNDWLMASRVEATPQEALETTELLRQTTPPPFGTSPLHAQALRDLDEFVGRTGGEKALSPRDLAGVWAGQIISFDSTGIGVLAVREDGEALILTGFREQSKMILGSSIGNTLVANLIGGQQSNRPTQTLDLIMSGEAALLLPRQPVGTRWSGHVLDPLLLIKTDEAPSEAANRLFRQEFDRLFAEPATRPGRRR